MFISLHGRGPLLTLAACGVLALGGCADDHDSNGDGNDEPADVRSSAQKGPFQPGGTVTAFALNADGGRDGDSVDADIGANGDFELPTLTWQGATEVEVRGTFYDEVSGTFTSGANGQATLRALARAPLDRALNVNLFTHLVAERARTLMNQGSTAGDALSQARADLRAIMGLSAAPARLDLLNGGASEDDSANLLLFSAAMLESGHGQAALDTMAADFADDGAINGDGADEMQAIRDTANNTANLLADVRTNLMNQYSVTPPADTDGEPPAWTGKDGDGGDSGDGGDGGDGGQELTACEAALLSEPRAVCVDEPFSGTANGTDADDDGEFVVFIPPEDGYYTVELFGDPAVDNDNTNQCAWTVHTEASTDASERGDGAADGRFCGVEDVTSSRLAGERRYYIRPEVSREEEVGDAHFRLSVSRNSEGSASRDGAVDLGTASHDGVVGTLIGTSTQSYYRFTAGTGTHRISLSGYPCGGSGYLWLKLYEPGNSDPAFSNRIASSAEDGACSQTIERALDAGRDYFVEVENRLSGFQRTSFRPAPGAVSYDLNVTTGVR